MNSIFIKKQLDFVKTTIKDQNANILDSIKLFTDFLNVVSQTVFERKKHSMNREKSGFLSKKWYDLECSLLAEKVRTIKHLHGIVSPQHREAIKGYKKLCKRKKFNYELRISEQLRSLKGTEPKQFWDLLKQGFEKPKLGNIKMQNWFTYFRDLAKAEDAEILRVRKFTKLCFTILNYTKLQALLVLPMRFLNGVLIGSWTFTRQSLMNCGNRKFLRILGMRFL